MPIHFAIESGCDGCLRELTARDKSLVNVKDGQGDAAAIPATRGGPDSAVKFLLTNKAKVNEKSQDRWTPFLAAVQGSHQECVRALLNRNASPTETRKGVSALKMGDIGGSGEIAAVPLGAAAKK